MKSDTKRWCAGNTQRTGRYLFNASFGLPARLFDRRTTRNDETDGFPQRAYARSLDFLLRAVGRSHDTRIEREDLHRHVHAALLRPPRNLYVIETVEYDASGFVGNALGGGAKR